MADIPESTKLLPCPFCGGKAYPGRTTYSRPLDDARWADGSPIMETHSINCASCGGANRGGTIGGYQTVERAIAAWNTRAAPPAMDREAVERLREAVMEDEHLDGVRLPHSDALAILSTLSADAIRQGEGEYPECNVCGGDCAGANPPVVNCPTRLATPASHASDGGKA